MSLIYRHTLGNYIELTIYKILPVFCVCRLCLPKVPYRIHYYSILILYNKKKKKKKKKKIYVVIKIWSLHFSFFNGNLYTVQYYYYSTVHVHILYIVYTVTLVEVYFYYLLIYIFCICIPHNSYLLFTIWELSEYLQYYAVYY